MHLCTKVKHGFWHPTDSQKPQKWPQQGTVRTQVTTWQRGSRIQLLRAELLWGQHVSCDVNSFYCGSFTGSRLILRLRYTGQYTDTSTKVLSRLSAKAQVISSSWPPIRPPVTHSSCLLEMLGSRVGTHPLLNKLNRGKYTPLFFQGTFHIQPCITLLT